MKPVLQTVEFPPQTSRESGSLLIVTGTKPGLYAYVRRLLHRDPRIQVVLDRRRIERRQRLRPTEVDRRRTGRRAEARVAAELRARGWAMVPARTARPLGGG
jgi:hypothetical protein